LFIRKAEKKVEQESKGNLLCHFVYSWQDSISRPVEDMQHNRTYDTERGYPIDNNHKSRIHFALCGRTLDVIRKHFTEYLPRILCRATGKYFALHHYLFD